MCKIVRSGVAKSRWVWQILIMNPTQITAAHTPCDTGDCARNYGGASTGTACTTCGYVHCDYCEGTRLVDDSGDIEFDTCSHCDTGAARCEGCGEPATRRYMGRVDGEPFCATCPCEDDETPAPPPADPGRTKRIPNVSMQALVYGAVRS